MAIEDILRTLEEQAAADIEAVLEEARQHATLVVDEAKRDAEKVRSGYKNQAERSAGSEAAKRLNAARLEAKMAVSSARGDAVDNVFGATRGQLATVRGGAGYDALFAKLADEAMAGLSGPVVVHVDPADAQRASALSASGVTITVETDIESAGGLYVEADGGRVVRRNTLEDRLERVRQHVQAEVAKALFE
jgi:vacuolar-type H+-ATPase subunit E/Vma4